MRYCDAKTAGGNGATAAHSCRSYLAMILYRLSGMSWSETVLVAAGLDVLFVKVSNTSTHPA